MPSKKQHDLLSKSDIAKALGMTSQTFSNRQSRDANFPPPTYSNRSGSVALYAPEDAKKVYEYCTRAERERLRKAEQMFASLTGAEPDAFEDVKLPIEDEKPEAPKAEAPKVEAPKAEEKAEEKPAAAPAKTEAPAKAETPAKMTEAEKAAKAKATAAKIQAADEKIAAQKKAAAPAAPAQAPKAAAPATKAPASKGTGAAFGIKA